jgi:hypothetical protein
VGEGFDSAKRILLSLTDDELRRIADAIPLIRRVVRLHDDPLTSAGLSDLGCEAAIQSVLRELDSDLHALHDPS